MKKITFLMLAVPLVFAACSTTNNAPSNSNNAATTPATEKPAEKPTEVPKSTEAQTLESVSRLEALEKRLAAVEAQLARIAATTSGVAPPQNGQLSGGQKFIGIWTPVVGEANITISRDGDLYVLTGYPFDREAFIYKDGATGDLTYSESSKHIFFFGREYRKLSSPTKQ